jgi:predicted transcriptional regulator
MSLKSRISTFYAKNYPKIINGGEIERLAMNIGKKASNASRRLRELHEEGILERIQEGKSVAYRYIPREPIKVEPKQMSLV